MIVAAGLSPAWQQILLFDGVRVGEVNRAAEAHWCSSGKVLNVGLALAHLRAEAVTIAPLGGLPRQQIEQEFAALGARGRWIECRAATRVCTTLLDHHSHTTTELVENQPALSAEELSAFARAFAEEVARAKCVVLTGSLPADTPSTFWEELLAKVSSPAASSSLAALHTILDFRGPELEAALAHCPLVVKPNREELAKTVGRSLNDDTQLLAAMRELNARGAQWVVITQGKDAVWVTHDGDTWRLQPPSVAKVVNPIGCGDCLAAGIAWGVSQGLDVLESVRLGMAAAAENLGQLLPGRIDAKSVTALARGIVVEPLKPSR